MMSPLDPDGWTVKELLLLLFLFSTTTLVVLNNTGLLRLIVGSFDK